mmetsp:Transcript_20094/g.47139  ORF Transcript_20094/g.47139 Transcript_20094/m.47139 type:complete len:802 (-) Transcript_20094:47-2452(-)
MLNNITTTNSSSSSSSRVIDNNNNNHSSSCSNLGTNHHISAATSSAPHKIHQSSSSTDAASMVSHGLSASELMSATSLHNRERQFMRAELLKQQQQQHRHHYLGHREQVATAMALTSRNHPFSTLNSHNKEQQQPGSREDLILSRAISQLSAVSRHHHLQQHPEHDRKHLLRHHPTASSATAGFGMDDPRKRGSLCRAEPDLSPEKDICFGRGQRVQRRKANVAFRKIVATYQETYDQAVSREDKKAVVKKVSRIFSRTGYRFFKEREETAAYSQHGSSTKMWIAVEDNEVEYKIGHSFRSGRKQIKQQQKHNQQRLRAKGGGGTTNAAADGGSSSGRDAQVNSSTKDLKKKSTSRSMAANEASNNGGDSVLKEDELSDKCIYIGDRRDKYTGMEAYQYFREFILTFKSIFGTSESFDEKTRIVSSLIEQFKSNKGYRFLKLMSMKKDVEFWVEASTEDIQCEVLFILGSSPLQSSSNEKKLEHNDTKETRSSIEQNEAPKKRQRLSPHKTFIKKYPPPSPSLKRIITDEESPRPTTNDNGNDTKTKSTPLKPLSPSKKHPDAPNEQSAVSSSSPSSKKGRKRALPKATISPTTTEMPTWIPSETNCERSTATADSIGSNSKASKDGTLSTTHRPGLYVPSSLSLPSVLFGSMPSQLERSPSSSLSRVGGGSHLLAAAGDVASRAKMLPRRDGGQAHQLPGFGMPVALAQDTLGKALHAMRSSTSPSPPPNNVLARVAVGTTSSERSLLVVKAKQLEAAKHFEIRANLLERLKQQELLLIEKKHRLDLLDLQLQSPESRMM